MPPKKTPVRFTDFPEAWREQGAAWLAALASGADVGSPAHLEGERPREPPE